MASATKSTPLSAGALPQAPASNANQHPYPPSATHPLSLRPRSASTAPSSPHPAGPASSSRNSSPWLLRNMATKRSTLKSPRPHHALTASTQLACPPRTSPHLPDERTAPRRPHPPTEPREHLRPCLRPRPTLALQSALQQRQQSHRHRVCRHDSRHDRTALPRRRRVPMRMRVLVAGKEAS